MSEDTKGYLFWFLIPLFCSVPILISSIQELNSWELKSDYDYRINAYKEYDYTVTHIRSEPLDKIHKCLGLGFVLRYDYGYNTTHREGYLDVISQVMLTARESNKPICTVSYDIYSKKMSNKRKIAFLDYIESSDDKDFMYATSLLERAPMNGVYHSVIEESYNAINVSLKQFE